MRSLLCLILTCSIAHAAYAAEWSGYVAVEGRAFAHGAQYPGQDSSGLSLVLEPEFYHAFETGKDSITFVPFLRVDQYDDRRTHADIRELMWLHEEDDWDLRVGIAEVYWGVIESRHLVNIINQDDAVEDVDGEDKLGQPMVNLGLIKDWGNLNLFVLPGFRERTFPGKQGRLRGPLIVDVDRPVYESSLKERHIDFAARYSHVIDIWDIGLSHFWGTSREPRLEMDVDGNGTTILRPHYDIIHQTGLDIQATIDAWLWKLETIYRTGHGRGFVATAAGFEYTFFSAFESDADIGVLVEYLYDDRDMSEAPATPFDNDIFVGSRFALNDVQSTEILAGGAVDLNHGSTSLVMEASRRIGDSWKVEVDVRLFTNIDEEDVSFGIRKDDHIQLRLSKYF